LGYVCKNEQERRSVDGRIADTPGTRSFLPIPETNDLHVHDADQKPPIFA